MSSERCLFLPEFQRIRGSNFAALIQKHMQRSCKIRLQLSEILTEIPLKLSSNNQSVNHFWVINPDGNAMKCQRSPQRPAAPLPRSRAGSPRSPPHHPPPRGRGGPRDEPGPPRERSPRRREQAPRRARGGPPRRQGLRCRGPARDQACKCGFWR